MTERPSTEPVIDQQDGDYRTVEPWSVGGLLAGLASVVALAGGLGLLVAAGAMLASLIALVRIHRDPSRSGRPAAIAGLALSTVFLVTPIVQSWVSYLLLSQQARPIAEQWFQELRHGRPERAVRLTFVPEMRPPLDDAIWLYFRHDDDAKSYLLKFVRDPLVKTLLALGEKAQVRFYETRSAVGEGELGGTHYVYTVTYPDADGQKKTFFVSILMERKPTRNPALNPWRVKAYFPGIEPKAR